MLVWKEKYLNFLGMTVAVVVVVKHCWTDLKGGQKNNSSFIREQHHCGAAGRVSQRQL